MEPTPDQLSAASQLIKSGPPLRGLLAVRAPRAPSVEEVHVRHAHLSPGVRYPRPAGAPGPSDVRGLVEVLD
eukprot:6315657-Alexandrium_andersonii.AAC.1